MYMYNDNCWSTNGQTFANGLRFMKELVIVIKELVWISGYLARDFVNIISRCTYVFTQAICICTSVF